MMFKIFASIIAAGLALSLMLAYLPLNMSRLFAVEDKIALSEDPDAVEREILRIIPVGSTIDRAKQMMEKNGFGCESTENGEFVRWRDDKMPQVAHDSNLIKMLIIFTAIIVKASWFKENGK